MELLTPARALPPAAPAADEKDVEVSVASEQAPSAVPKMSSSSTTEASVRGSRGSRQTVAPWHALKLEGLEGITQPLYLIQPGEKSIAKHRSKLAGCTRQTLYIEETIRRTSHVNALLAQASADQSGNRR